MPTNLPNRARINYTNNGVAQSVLSNQTNTTLVDEYTIQFTKDALNTTITSGGNTAFSLSLENTGSGDIYNPTIVDNLGNSRLTYIVGTDRYYVNGTPSSGTATQAGEQVTFSSNAVLRPGDNLLVLFEATDNGTSTAPITNSATATVNSGSATGPALTETDTVDITIQSEANLSIFKSASSDNIYPGDALTYTFTLMNTGGEAVNDITFSDVLPPEFTVNSVSYTINDTTTPIPPTDYSITEPNTLTIPAEASALSIPVPAATVEGPGITTITVSGIVNNI